MRKTKDEIQNIKDYYNVGEIWSWSKINKIRIDRYGAFLSYIEKAKEDNANSIFSFLGNALHDCMESFYKGEITMKEALDIYKDKSFEAEIMELKFDRSDDEKNSKIAKKYHACNEHFFDTFEKENDMKNVRLEEHIVWKVSKFLFQGYVDMMHVDSDGNLIITDFKSSSIYKGSKIDSEKNQLLLYAYAMYQKEGWSYDKIKVRWLFTKYVDIDYQQKNGTMKTRTVERNSIGESLATNIKMWLKHEKYSEEDINRLEHECIVTNSIDNLPQEVKNRFVIKPCYVYIPFDKDDIRELNEGIIHTIVDWLRSVKEYNKTGDDKVFWVDIDSKNSYYFANLCGYSRMKHKPYDSYLTELEVSKGVSTKEDDDLSFLDELY